MIPKTLLATALAGLAPFAPAMAQSFTDSATVIAARPLMERVPVNREECWNEQRQAYEERTAIAGPEGQRCRTVQEMREVPTGYEVRYRYGGREFVTRMPYDPGPRLRIAVDVRPLEEGAPPPRHPTSPPVTPRY